MIGRRAGLYVQGSRLALAVLAGRRLEHCLLAAEEGNPALLGAEIAQRRLRVRRVRVGLDRAQVTVKPLDLPPDLAGNLEAMLPFELERHVPFTSEDMAWDWLELPRVADGPLRVLVAVTEGRVVDRVLRLLAEPRLRPQSVGVACHDLPALLERRGRASRVVWAHRAGSATDLVYIARGQVRLSRSVASGDATTLAADVAASLPLLKWRDLEAVWVSGDGAAELRASREWARLGVPATDPPLAPGVAAMLEEVPEGERALITLAVAAALGPRQPPLNLLAPALRPRTWSVGDLATAAMVAATLGLGLAALLLQGHRDQRYLSELDVAVRQMDAEVRVVERLSAELNDRKRLLATLTGLESASLRPLPVLRELTDLLPHDAWLSSLTLDNRGVELTGQASSASQLIPMLEGSVWFERVEFTSPVTRGRDKEQFRLRASWEKPGGAVSPGASPPTAPARAAAQRPVAGSPPATPARPGAGTAPPGPPATPEREPAPGTGPRPGGPS